MRHLDRARLVVMEQIADIGQTGLGHQVQGLVGVRQRRREPAVEFLTGVLFDGVDRVADEFALLVRRHVKHIARVVGAVGVKLPTALDTGGNDLGVVFTQSHVERHAAAHAAAVHGLHHAPHTHSVAVVAVRISLHIRDGPGPWGALGVGRGLEFIKLDVGRDPKSQLRAIGPANGRAVLIGQKVVKARIAFHDGKPSR